MLLSKGVDSVLPEQINEWEYLSQMLEAKAAIPKVVAETWLDLNKKGALPSWAIAQVKLNMMEKAAL